MGAHLYTYADPPSERDLGRAIRCLENDGTLAYPTEVNWAFGCDAGNVRALDRIRQLKPAHPKERPFTLICADIAMAATVGHIDHYAYRYLKRIWPGPYTVLLRRNRSLPRQMKDKRPVVGVRIPASPLVLALVKKFGRPLATTSVPMKNSGTPYQMGFEVFEDFGHGIDLVLDLGQSLPGLESTIVDFSEGAPIIIREGVGDPTVFGIS